MGLAVIPVLIIAGCITTQAYTPQQIDAIAQCMSDNGAVMYGSYVCSSCQEQEDMFGPSFQYINYTECHPNGPDSQYELCIEKGIQGTPTWMMGDTTMLGRKSIAELAEFSGCAGDENG